MKGPKGVVKSAKKYLGIGWSVIPVPHKKKAPQIKKWQNLRLTKSQIEEHFGHGDNIGVLLGEPSGGLVDIDKDCMEAISLASHFLPETDRIHGRKSKRSSHSYFRCIPTPPPQKFSDIDGTCLVELRSTGQQTIVPPSIHPSGERLRWYIRGRPARVRATDLLITVKRLAAASLFARHWPNTGARHDAALAMAGTLLATGWNEAETKHFVARIAQAAHDEEWEAREADVHSTWKRFRKGAKTTGRHRLATIMGPDVVNRACEWLGICNVLGPPSGTGGIERPWPKSLSNRAYHGLAGDIVRAIGPITEADEPGLLLQLLICFGNAAGRNANFRIGAAEQHTNLYGVLVGRTAKARKGTAWAEIERLFESVDPKWAERCLLPGGLASGEGLVWAVRDAVKKIIKSPNNTRRIRERIKNVDEGVEDKRLLVIETEFGSPLRVIRREGNILSAVLRRAWDKGNLANQTKASPARATHAHISIVGHITREELLRELSTADGNNGFANRFLWICVQRTKFLPLGGSLPEETSNALINRLQNALAFATKARELRFTKQAKELWYEVYPELGKELPGLVGAITSRAEPQVIRISEIYALLERSNFISTKHLKAALAVWKYCEDSARYIFGDALGEPVVDKIIRRLRKSDHGLTRNDIREIFSRNRSEAEIDNALRILKEHRMAKCIKEETGGRPSARWFAVG